MKSATIVNIAVSSKLWSSYPEFRSMKDLYGDLSAAQRRIERGVNVRVERKRCVQLCRALESHALALAASGKAFGLRQPISLGPEVPPERSGEANLATKSWWRRFIAWIGMMLWSFLSVLRKKPALSLAVQHSGDFVLSPDVVEALADETLNDLSRARDERQSEKRSVARVFYRRAKDQRCFIIRVLTHGREEASDNGRL